MTLEPFKIVFQVHMHQKDEGGNVLDEVTTQGDPFSLYSHQFNELAERVENIVSRAWAQGSSANVGTEQRMVFPAANGN